MAVTVYVPGPLREHTGGASSIAVDGAHATVADVLVALFRLHPGLRDRLLDEPGAVRRHVHLFVGDRSIRDADGLATAVPADAEVTILPAVSGG